MSTNFKDKGYEDALALYMYKEASPLSAVGRAASAVGRGLWKGTKWVGHGLFGHPIQYAKELRSGAAHKPGGMLHKFLIHQNNPQISALEKVVAQRAGGAPKFMAERSTADIASHLKGLRRRNRAGKGLHYGLTLGFPAYEMNTALRGDPTDDDGNPISRGEAVSRVIGGNLGATATLPLGLVGVGMGYSGGQGLGSMLYKGLGGESAPVQEAQQVFESPQQSEMSMPTLQNPKISQTLNVSNTSTAPIAVTTPPAPDPINPITPAVAVPGKMSAMPNSTTQLPSGTLSTPPQSSLTGLNPALGSPGGGSGPGLPGGARGNSSGSPGPQNV